MNNKSKKKMRTSNRVLIASILAVVVYTIAAFILQWNTNVEISPILTEYWYKFWTIEVSLLAGIRVSKVIKNKDNYIDSYNEDEYLEGDDE